jgi:hypothetical protein
VNDHLKIISSVIFIAAFFAVPAQADPGLPSPIPPASPTQTTPAQPAPVQAQPTIQTGQQAPANAADPNLSLRNGPVQTDTVPTDHTLPKPPKAHTFYNYAHDESEYSVSLPGAPTVSTIWSETPDTKPFLRYAPTDHGALGESAVFKLVDIDTEETFDVKITFLRATSTFLDSLDDERIHKMLVKKFSEVTLSNETFNIANGTGSLKWASLQGFVLDSHHHPAFYALHYLTGLQSILVIEAKYSIENKTFQDYYNHMIDSVTYVRP